MCEWKKKLFDQSLQSKLNAMRLGGGKVFNGFTRTRSLASVVSVHGIQEYCIQCSVQLILPAIFFFKQCETECIMQTFQTVTCNIVVT